MTLTSLTPERVARPWWASELQEQAKYWHPGACFPPHILLVKTNFDLQTGESVARLLAGCYDATGHLSG
ncbi:hypothetical protein GN956_G18213 [Arapaima gigas]